MSEVQIPVVINHENVKKAIADHLEIELSDQWEIMDAISEEDLYLVHYVDDVGDAAKDTAKRIKFGKIRGIIVHVKPIGNTFKCVTVNKAFGYIPHIERDQLNSTLEILVDNLGQQYKIDLNVAIFKKGHDGMTIRLFFFNGKVRYSSYRKIDIYGCNARWFKSDPFHKIYDDLKAPKGETLYDMTKKYSPHVHIVILVHKDLHNVSREDLGKSDGYVIYIASRKVWDTSSTPYGDIDEQIRMPSNLTHKVEEARNGDMVYTPPNLTLDQINSFLRYGWHKPPNLKVETKKLPGEFVIGYLEGEKSKTIVKIQSSAYTWRNNIRNNEPNYYYRFCQLMEHRLSFDESLFQKYHKYEVGNIIGNIAVIPMPIYLEAGRKINNTDPIYNIWISYLMSVPLHKQKEVSLYMVQYMSHLEQLCSYLFSIYEKGDYLNRKPTQDIADRVYKLINLANDHWIRDASTNPNRNFSIKRNLKYLLDREKGSNVYSLIRYMESNFELFK